MNPLTLLNAFGQQPTSNAPTGAFDFGAAIAPLVSGVVMGYTVYRIAKSMKVDRLKARGIAVTVGVTVAVGQISNTWFHGWLSKAGVA